MPGSSLFGPRQQMPSWRKPMTSDRMKKIQKDVMKGQAYFRRPVMANRTYNANKREDDVTNKALKHGRKTFESSKAVDEKDKIVALQTQRNPLEDSNIRQSNTLAMGKSARKSNNAVVPPPNGVKRPTPTMLHNLLIPSSKDVKASKPSGLGDAFSSENLEEHVLRPKDDLNATVECSKLIEGLTRNSTNIGRSNSWPNHVNPLTVMDHKANNVDPSNHCNDVLGSMSKGRPNSHREESVVRKGSIGRLKSLKTRDKATTSKGSNFSMEKEHLLPSNDCLNENKKCKDQVMVDKDDEIQAYASVASIDRTISGEVHFMCHDHHKPDDFLKENEAPNSSSALKGHQVIQDLQCKSRNNSFPIFGEDLSSYQRAKASFMSNNMERNGDPRDGCIRLDSKRQNTSFADDGRTDDDMLKSKRTEPLLEEKLETHDDEVSEAVNRRLMKRRRRSIENEDEEAYGGDQNLVGVGDGTAGLTSRTATMTDHTDVSMSFVSESVKWKHHAHPIDEPVWSGIFKICSKEYISLTAYLSTKSCERVWEFSRLLLPVVEVTKLSRFEAWPKSLEPSGPTEDNIALFFFPHEMRTDEDLDQLIKEVAQNDMVLRAVIGEAELLIFPSTLLPDQKRTFKGKHYLWGVFKRRKDNVAVVEEEHGTGRCAHRGVGKVDIDLQAPEEAERRGTEQGPSRLAGHAAKATTSAPTTAAAMPANNGSLGVPPQVTVFGFVAQRTPRIEKLMQEMEREGALVVAVRGEMMGSGLGQAVATE